MQAAEVREIVREELEARLPDIIDAVMKAIQERYFPSEGDGHRKKGKVKPERILQMIAEAPAQGVRKTEIVRQIGCGARQVNRYMDRFRRLGLYLLEVEPARGRANVGGKGRFYYPHKLTNKAKLILRSVNKLPAHWLTELERAGWIEFCRSHRLYPQQ
ncbi:MAG: hypothetical protein QMD10_09570 [Desulfitobacteriaceae bacterium]|nr:hypothetical protein [Desulfitobacteriaceae bacterium]